MGKKYSFKASKYKNRGRRQRKGAIGKEVSCTGKIKWWSKERAQQQADDVNKRLIGDRKVRAYHCIHCGDYHVGREPRTAH